jgi:hypothetical protein
MTRAQAWGVHLATLAVGGTGLVYGWMRYACEPPDEFALVNHPLQPTLQHLHVLLAPLLVFAAAVIWWPHVWTRVRAGFRPSRSTGLALFALFFPMALSGAWVQMAEGELARKLAIGLHAGSGALWCAAYALHVVLQAWRGKIGPSAESTAASKRSA